jgi:hypothetical protein
MAMYGNEQIKKFRAISLQLHKPIDIRQWINFQPNLDLLDFPSGWTSLHCELHTVFAAHEFLVMLECNMNLKNLCQTGHAQNLMEDLVKQD